MEKLTKEQLSQLTSITVFESDCDSTNEGYSFIINREDESIFNDVVEKVNNIYDITDELNNRGIPYCVSSDIIYRDELRESEEEYEEEDE